jgi:hypothetical protein
MRITFNSFNYEYGVAASKAQSTEEYEGLILE